MRSGFSIALIATLLFGGGYWFYIAEAVCDVPLAYRIGTIDPNFELSTQEARNIIADAGSLWEDATGRNLFTYDPTSDFTINFIFDDRQAYYNAEENLREELENREEMSTEASAKYKKVQTQYESLKAKYEARVRDYESRLADHNDEVADWNERGGAPADVFTQLGVRQKELANEQVELNRLARSLNELVRTLNEIGREGNVLVSAYNNVVEVYNDRFNDEHEFTQGDYQGDRINIYQYSDFDELRLVMAHEFGHALSLEHVEGEESIMYHFMGAQSLETGVTTEDVAEFHAVCGTQERSPWSIF